MRGVPRPRPVRGQGGEGLRGVRGLARQHFDSRIPGDAAAQAAEVKRQQAQNEQETAKVEAETKKIQAQGEADANAILAQSLNDQVLRQHYIDALNNAGSNGSLVVVPEGSTPLVSAGK